MNLKINISLVAATWIFALHSIAQRPGGEVLYEEVPVMMGAKYTKADAGDESQNWVKKPIIVDNSDKSIIENPISNSSVNTKKWILTREKDKTVMHCYFVMPDFPCTGLWLGGDETFIVDANTGIHYQARGTDEKAIWGESFALNAPAGSIVDFHIYFPPLPEGVTNIRLYGVPRWASRGGTILKLTQNNTATWPDADKLYEQFALPRLTEQHGPYNKDDIDTYDVYEDIQTIRPTKEHSMAIWCTPEATYMAIACEMNWNREYFGFSSQTVLIDEQTRKMYKIRRIMGDIPMDNQFFISGKAGDWIAFLLEFEPLPYSESLITIDPGLTISYSEPEGTPFDVWGAGWASTFYEHLSLQQLKYNRSQFMPFERTIVK